MVVGGDDQVQLTVTEGSAGFTCDEGLLVTNLKKAGLAAQVGVTVAMRLTQFQGKSVDGATWNQVKEQVKASAR